MSFLRSIITGWAAVEQLHLTDSQRASLERLLDRFDRGQLAQWRSIVVAAQALRGAMQRQDDGSYRVAAAEVAALDRLFATVPEWALVQAEREQAIIKAAVAFVDLPPTILVDPRAGAGALVELVAAVRAWRGEGTSS